jgi:Domain of unknown function (DUF4148)
MQGIQIMKQLALLTLTLSALVSSTLTFAQSSSAPLTRAQVRADLIRLEQAGYNPSAGDDVNYPADIQAAEARAAAQNAAQGDQQRAVESMGGTQQRGSSEAGKPTAETPARSIYFGQ